MSTLFVIAEMGVGGAEAIVADLAEALIADGDEVAVASNGGWRADALAGSGVRPVPISLRGRTIASLAAAARDLRRELRTHPPELVHVHNVKAAAVLRAATVGLRRPPTVVTLHGVPDGSYAASARLLRVCADRVVTVSGDVADRIVADGFPRDRIDVIENAVSAPEPGEGHAARAVLELAQDAPVALCLARLVDQKRHDLLVDAWQSMPADAVLLLAGDGPNRDRIRAQIQRLGLGDRVRLLGARSDIGRLLAAADLTVLASDWEGLPISILESMASGVPVVATAVGGLADALDGAACLVEPGSADALTAGMTRLLTDSGFRDKLVGAGHDLIAERFSLQRMHTSYRRLYRSLADTNRRERPTHLMKTTSWQGGRSDRPLLRTFRNATRPGFLPVMARKVMVRVKEQAWREHPESVGWAAEHAEPVDVFARGLDAALWDESVEAGEELRRRGEDVLPPLGIDLGGGGHYPLLYFLVRHFRPEVVIETGVAAGYSSRAMLRALQANDAGHLYSSDFPYFRVDNPEQYIGILVEPELRSRWTLRTKGDRVNLPEILGTVDGVDLFHYDSDKPVDGRRYAFGVVEPKLRPGGILLMDDINDNEYFREYVESRGCAFRVFEFGGKYIGAVGLPT